MYGDKSTNGNTGMDSAKTDPKVIIGGRTVKEIPVIIGTPFKSQMIQFIADSGFTDVKVQEIDSKTGKATDIPMSNPPQTFEAGKVYQIMPYDRPGK